MADRGLLIVLSGPSGAGKGTICSRLRAEMPNLVYSVSMTTRQPRVGEVEGVNYFFRTKEEFEELLKEDAFIEYAQVYDNYYGTPKEHVMNLLDEGKSVLLEIDIQGAMQVKERYSDAIFIYIVPPSLTELSARLRGRATDAEDVIDKRLSLACSELALAHRYDYIVVNDDLDEACEKTASILRAESCKISRNKEKIQYIYKQYQESKEK
ncbi:MAG: guanylate kinase [Veillonella sp.]|nr:guanylate kinase [Veillonella sp.]